MEEGGGLVWTACGEGETRGVGFSLWGIDWE